MASIDLGGSIGVPGGVAVLGNFNVIYTSDADHTLSATEWSNQFLDVTSSVSLTATHQLIGPLNQGQLFIIQNNTTGGQVIEVIGATGTGVMVPNGSTMTVVCDGTNYLSAGGGSGTLAGDVTGPSGTNTLSNIHGSPLAGTSPVQSSVIVYDTPGDLYDIRPLITDDVFPGFTIATFSGGSVTELGSTITNPTFTATYSSTPTSAFITNTDAIDSPLTLITPFTSGTVVGSFSHNFVTSVTFTLQAVLTSTQHATQTISFEGRDFGGLGAAGATTTVSAGSFGSNTAILSTGDVLSDEGLFAGTEPVGTSFGPFSPTNQKIYLFLQGNGHVFNDQNGFLFPFNPPSTVTFINQYGAFVTMYLYESTNLLSTPFTLTVGPAGPEGLKGPMGDPGLGLNQSLNWVPLTSDSPTTIYTLVPPLSDNECINIAATINMAESTGMDGYSAIWSRRFYGIQNVSGVLADPVGTTHDIDSITPIIGSFMGGSAAQIAISGTDLIVQATRPPGLSCFAAATVDFVRGIPGASSMVTGISPNNLLSTVSSPTLLTVTLNFGGNGAIAINVNGTYLINVTVINDTTVTGILPVGTYSAGTGNVYVTAPSNPNYLSNGFTFGGALPTVSRITPNVGSAGGGNAITVIGTNLGTVTTCTINGMSCTSIANITSTSFTCVTPAYSSPNGTSTGQVIAVNGHNCSTGVPNSFFYYPSNTAVEMLLRGDVGITLSGSSIIGWRIKQPITITSWSLAVLHKVVSTVLLHLYSMVRPALLPILHRASAAITPPLLSSIRQAPDLASLRYGKHKALFTVPFGRITAAARRSSIRSLILVRVPVSRTERLIVSKHNQSMALAPAASS